MRTAAPPPFLDRMLARLIRAFAPERIILFGSYVTGKAHAASDVDLMVVAEFHGDLQIHLQRARQIVADAPQRIDVGLCRPEDVAAAPNDTSPFLLYVLENGVTIYDRPS